MALACIVLALGCGPPPEPPKPSEAPPPPPPTASETAPPPEPAETAEPAKPAPPPPETHECGQNHAEERPILIDKVGEGERIVRLINNSESDVQARLLDEKLKTVFPGTMRIEPGKTGEFHVDAGVYYVRYRLKKSCEVRRGSKLVLTGNRAGVEIAIKPKFNTGSKSHMRPVAEPL